MFASSSTNGSTFGQKPAFGVFGSSTTQSSPFGSSFQQSQPAFGSSLFGSSTPFGASSTPAFGATSTPAFGSTATPAFGETGSAFGISSTSVFGSSSPAFGASSTPAFVASNTSAFGTSSTPAFGVSISPSFSFGSSPASGQSTSAFGSSPFGTTSLPFGAQSSPFGAQTATTPTFESHGFGQNTFRGQCRGSRVAVYTPTPEVDGGHGTQPAGKLESISAMTVYKDKSHEELRWEDYRAADKGEPNTQSNPFASSSTFGQSAANPFSSSTPANNPFAPKTPAFGSQGFGTTTTPEFGTSTSNLFGAAASTPSLFGSTPAFGTTSSAPLFGSSSSPAFGTSTSPFGSGPAHRTAPLFGTGLSFGNTQPSPLFQSTAPSHGQSNSAFGQTASSFRQTTPAFGQSSLFSTPSTGFGNLFSSTPSLLTTSNPIGFVRRTPSLSTPCQPTQPSQTMGAFGFSNFGQTQSAAPSGFGGTCIFCQKNFGQVKDGSNDAQVGGSEAQIEAHEAHIGANEAQIEANEAHIGADEARFEAREASNEVNEAPTETLEAQTGADGVSEAQVESADARVETIKTPEAIAEDIGAREAQIDLGKAIEVETDSQQVSKIGVAQPAVSSRGEDLVSVQHPVEVSANPFALAKDTPSASGSTNYSYLWSGLGLSAEIESLLKDYARIDPVPFIQFSRAKHDLIRNAQIRLLGEALLVLTGHSFEQLHTSEVKRLDLLFKGLMDFDIKCSHVQSRLAALDRANPVGAKRELIELTRQHNHLVAKIRENEQCMEQIDKELDDLTTRVANLVEEKNLLADKSSAFEQEKKKVEARRESVLQSVEDGLVGRDPLQSVRNFILPPP